MNRKFATYYDEFAKPVDEQMLRAFRRAQRNTKFLPPLKEKKMTKKKKKKETELAKLEKRMDGFEAQAHEDNRQMERLQRQVKCGVVGHALWFDRCACSFYGNIFIFKCRCGLEIFKSVSELTAKEKIMLKKLKVLEEAKNGNNKAKTNG